MPDNLTIGKRLQQVREAIRPVSPNTRQFALKADVDPSQYNKAEKGIKGLGNNKLLGLCSTWSINKDWLFTGKGNMFETANEDKIKEGNVNEEQKASKQPDAQASTTSFDLLLRTVNELLATNKIIAESTKISAESKRLDSETNNSLARSNEELVQMLKTKGSFTVGVDPKTQQQMIGTVLGIRTMLEQIAAKVNKQALSDVQNSLDKMVMDSMQHLQYMDTVELGGK